MVSVDVKHHVYLLNAVVLLRVHGLPRDLSELLWPIMNRSVTGAGMEAEVDFDEGSVGCRLLARSIVLVRESVVSSCSRIMEV